MPDSDQILDKYAQLKLDLKLQEDEKQRKIQEELDAKNPLKQYEKIQRELAESKEKYSGCTVHFVSSKLDSGKIILQKKVLIEKNESEKSLKKKVLMQEHKLYPQSIISLFK